MRTVLLFALIMVIGYSGLAQKRPAPGKIALKPAIDMTRIRTHPNEVPVQHVTPRKPKMPVKSANMINLIPIGSSVNVYSALYPVQRCMDYDVSTNLIMATYRGDPLTPGFATGNDVVTAYSTDRGATWEETLGFQGSTGKRCRYPSGLIFNPAGNTDPANVYSVTAGPVTDGTSWTFNFFGSVTKAGTNVSQFWELDTLGESLFSSMIVNDSCLAAIGETYQTNDGNGYTGLIGFTEIGNFNGTTNSFDWTLQTWDPQEYIYYDTTNGWYRSWSSSYHMCFSKDCSIGYRWTDGVDNRATNGSSFYPIIYKTTDGGLTWNVLDYFDFGLLPEVYSHLINLATEDRVAPWFRDTDGVVDILGNLHIMAEVTSAVSVHPDSLTYYWTGDYGSIFEFVYENATNEWRCNWVDTLETDDPTGGTSGNSIFGTGADKEGWGKRIHAAISPDRKNVFAIWTDTDDYAFWGLQEPLNMYPDIQVWVCNVLSNFHSEPTNMTYEGGAGAAWGACYFAFASHTVIDDPINYRYLLPISIVDISTNGYDPGEPVYHYYLKDIEISKLDVSIPDADRRTRIVSGVVPNPVQGEARFNIRLAQASEVSMVVNGITGQELLHHSYGKMAGGEHTLMLGANRLSAGIYFLTVLIDGNKYTQKFIVQ